MDFLLPIASRLGVYLPLHWRDIPQSLPNEVTQTGQEPLSLDQAKQHLEIATSFTDWDPWLNSAIPAARRKVEADSNKALPLTTYEIAFDQFPLERWIPVPLPPFVDIVSFTWFDLLTSAESAVDPTTYFLDTSSQPGRVILVPGKVWPTGVRWQQGGRLRFKAGYADNQWPVRYVHAMKMLLGHWFANREAVVSGTTRHSPEEYPLGYDDLIGNDRLVSVG